MAGLLVAAPHVAITAWRRLDGKFKSDFLCKILETVEVRLKLPMLLSCINMRGMHWKHSRNNLPNRTFRCFIEARNS